ncbi:unnamed protein product [Paramecium sonneborni]|uniref:Uncharacterized protein n=1 Tax=Paramecium sonneborni TaxID=65129 RepID=A0A8S1JUK4_9CILI|nr:unnamed protein product [Paramecium sonneborni]
MTSIHSLISQAKQQDLQNKRSSKILQKPIAKWKNKLVKSSQSHFMQRDQGEQIYQIVHLDRNVESNQNIGYKYRSLGALFIDNFLMKGKILERQYENHSVEYKLSFFTQNTGIYSRDNLEYDKMMHFYKLLRYEMITENNRNTYEGKINRPYECFNFLFIDGKLDGIKKKMNYDLLRIMGINEEMIDDYIQKENQLPIFWDISKFVNINDGIYYNSNLINFQGEIFTSQIQIKRFIQSNSSQKISNQFLYFIYNCDRSQLNVNKIEKNFLSYFQLQSLSIKQQMQIQKSRIMKPCLFKPIIDQK